MNAQQCHVTVACMHDYKIVRHLLEFEELNTPGNFAKDRSPYRQTFSLVEDSEGKLHVVNTKCVAGWAPEMTLHTSQGIKGILK